ncbi:hypothetical protein BS50DRAFT_628566 [Corynespora cassiicola Philippines]|uniref:Uncharacterized protein n=1 Tax=Corynespora cassiicola Philippines TaxID=1448308 RepID=A0A2T2PCJ3_CORCC|nr:hypothetical protein BS50DRAFT_628566 [Corynespora cassiicola Philippines]
MSTGHALTPQYEKAVKSQADAERRRGQRPNDRKRRDAAIEAYNQNVMNSGMEILSIRMKGSNTPIPSMMRATFIPPAYLPSTAPLASLSPITIRELQLEMPHRGKYVALQGISSPIRPPATDFIVDSLVEDIEGEAALLTLHFQLDQD